MSVDRSTRTLLAILFLMAALFVAISRVVESAPAGDWWLPLLLLVIGAGFGLSLRYQLGSGQPGAESVEAEAMDEIAPGGDVHSYRVTATTTPLAQTMTIRPDPDEAEMQRVVSVVEEGVIPFVDEAASAPAPETDELSEPAATAAEEYTEMEAAIVAEGVAVADVEGEAAPETPAPAAAQPDTATAQKETPATPPAKSSETETEHVEPEKEVVAATMSAPQQSYESERVGDLTPERSAQVMSDSAPAETAPVVNEIASPRMTAQTRGKGTAGKPDDLTKVRGIGGKSAQALKTAGIDTFQKLAESTQDAIHAALDAGNVRLVGDADTWMQQAAYAARGDWEGLDQFNAEQRSASSD